MEVVKDMIQQVIIIQVMEQVEEVMKTGIGITSLRIVTEIQHMMDTVLTGNKLKD